MIYALRYPLGRLKLRAIEGLRSRRLPRLYAGFPNDSLSKLHALRNAYAGESCFIVGNGPSLRQLDLQRLRGRYCLFFNGAFDLRAYTTADRCIHLCEDRLVFEDHHDALNALPGLVFFPADFGQKLTSSSAVITEFHRGYPQGRRSWPPFVDLTAAHPIFYWGGTVAYYGLQIAKWLGFREIIFIGMDLTYRVPPSVIKKGSVLLSTEDDPNHYRPSYFGAGLRWHVPEPDRMLRAFERVAEQPALAEGVYNATPGGRLHCFPRVPFESVT